MRCQGRGFEFLDALSGLIPLTSVRLCYALKRARSGFTPFRCKTPPVELVLIRALVEEPNIRWVVRVGIPKIDFVVCAVLKN